MKTERRRQLAVLMLGCALLIVPGAKAAPLAGESLNLRNYRGKVVLVDFWASWCSPCRESFPWLNTMQARYAGRGFVVIGVNVDRERADADRFLKAVPAKFAIVYDAVGALATEYDVPGMPSSYLFDRDGRLISKHVGFRTSTRETREAELQSLLYGKTP